MIETELKLTAQEISILQSVLNLEGLGPVKTAEKYQHLAFDNRDFHGVYYDVGNFTLKQHGITLRARKQGDVFIAAVKFKGNLTDGLSVRKELEADCKGWFETVHDVPEGELRNEIIKWVAPDAKLIERVVVKMSRSIRFLDLGEGTIIELVTDTGTIQGPSGAKAVLHEVELELVEGEVEPLIDFGNQLLATYDLMPSTKTKHGIGLSL